MSTVKFLVDEDTPNALVAALTRQEPAIDVVKVGRPGAPPRGTKDPELLKVAEAEGRMLISRDKRTMPGHVANHLTAGHHTWGVYLLRRGFPLRRYVDNLILIWSSSQAEEWQDSIDWLPW